MDGTDHGTNRVWDIIVAEEWVWATGWGESSSSSSEYGSNSISTLSAWMDV